MKELWTTLIVLISVAAIVLLKVNNVKGTGVILTLAIIALLCVN